MRLKLKAARALGAIALLSMTAVRAEATEARPWLCRDKPAVSSAGPMTYTVSSQGAGAWWLFFMQFTPNGPHDGFSIVDSRDLGRFAQTQGQLPAGQYFVVALHRAGRGYWVCPDYAGENPRYAQGVIRTICYGSSPTSCAVKLTVAPK